jgi:hypothetical protein
MSRFLTMESGALILAPVIAIGEVVLSAASSKPGYLVCNGQTIGSSLSGANGRANSDVQALWEALWDNPSLQILTSSGSATTRTTKNADWAENKQISTPLIQLSPVHALIKYADADGEQGEQGAAVTPGWVRRWRFNPSRLTLDSGAISSWQGFNGESYSLNQTNAASRPTVQSNSVRFDGSNDFLLSQSASLSVGSIFIVFFQVSAGANYDGLLSARVAPNAFKGAASNENVMINNLPNSRRMTGDDGFTAVYSDGNQLNINDFLNYEVGIDPGAFDQIHCLHCNRAATQLGSKTFCIGADIVFAIGQRHFNGGILEILMYPNQLSEPERVLTTNALKAAYGIT